MILIETPYNYIVARTLNFFQIILENFYKIYAYLI